MIKRLMLFLSLCSFVFAGCKKDKEYIYQVDDVRVVPPGTSKPNVKSSTEFISIAYSDLYGKTIGNDKLAKLSIAYAGFGDRKLIEEIIIKNFLNDPSVSIPTKAAMTANLEDFVAKAYTKFYGREASAFEKWNMGNIIKSDTTLTPELVYYGFMTSNEYRYY